MNVKTLDPDQLMGIADDGIYSSDPTTRTYALEAVGELAARAWALEEERGNAKFWNDRWRVLARATDDYK